MNLGLFGGTFNPIHRCHLTIADQVRQRMALDRVVFIPAGIPPLKPQAALAPASDRLEMTRLAVQPYAWAEVSTIEIDRPGPSYSVETVEQLGRQRPGEPLYFLVGTDAFAHIMDWREPERLLRLCDLVVIPRVGHPFASLRSLPMLASIASERLQALDEGTPHLEEIQSAAGRRLWLLGLPPCPISATQVRAAVEAGAPLDALLPEAVRSYILRRRLYQ
ncbi:MAG: nicotinate-nucleotide adenylyltransferase [Nitrospirota bacterium]